MEIQTCKWPNCKRVVSPSKWGCPQHWFKLPLHLRNRIQNTCRTEVTNDKYKSEAQIQTENEVAKWINQNKED
jgi:hypothetical protein